jgi:N-acetylmuramoyl-L-alanine amidase
MKKRLFLWGLILLMIAVLTPLAAAIDFSAYGPPQGISVTIDGQPANLRIPVFMINSATYVPIRDFSTALGADGVSWDSGTATVTAPNLTITATVGQVYLVANGRYLFVPDTCILAYESVMVPVRVLAKAFGASVAWDQATQTVSVARGSGAIKPAGEFYDKTDLLWMSRIIQAEAGGESLIGKIAVGGVVMNRIASPIFPDTVYDVVFDRHYGVQFTPAYSGAIYNTPSEESVIAAKIALDGGNTAGDSLYFASTTHCWAGRSRPFAMTIGHHYFYA